MATVSAAERIAQIKAKAETEIKQLTAQALADLKEELKAAQAVVDGINSQIEELSGKPASTKGGGVRGTRKSITIEQVADSIKAGNTNYATVANHLGVSKANVANKIKAEGKKAGITSKGERASFVLSVK